MKKITMVSFLSLILFSGAAVSGDGPNPCEWESDPKPGFCPSEDNNDRQSLESRIPKSTDQEKRGGDNH